MILIYVLCFTETHLDHTVSSETSFSNIQRKDRSNHGGGIIIYLSNKIRAIRRKGPDLISHKMLKSTISTVAKPLTMLFNRSLSEKTFPSFWKLACYSSFQKGRPINGYKL
jgi:hypothetical protein